MSLVAATRRGLLVDDKDPLLPVVGRLLLCVASDGSWASIDWEGTEARREDVDCTPERDTLPLFLDICKAPFEELLPALEVEWRRT